ncbi:MAG: hypothetical protein GF331_00670 [Chitinivibrionales bacterium]|nr:hypothetical protein [Chitinivibrionales bacterium]
MSRELLTEPHREQVRISPERHKHLPDTTGSIKGTKIARAGGRTHHYECQPRRVPQSCHSADVSLRQRGAYQMSLHNFSWVIPQKLAGSALPGGMIGVPDDYILSDLGELREHGVHCVVSLQRMPQDFGRLCKQSRLEWIHFPIEDFSTPNDRASFDELVDELIAHMESNRPVCVHCRAGVGRTGMVLACVVGAYLGIDGDRATRAVRKTRPALDTPEQVAFVHEFCAARMQASARNRPASG